MAGEINGVEGQRGENQAEIGAFGSSVERRRKRWESACCLGAVSEFETGG